MKTVTVGLFFAAVHMASAEQPDTLQTLLAEVHQLRVDLENATIASQRVQIALCLVQNQDAAVVRAIQRLDQARGRCTGLEQNMRQTAEEVQFVEHRLSEPALPPAEANVLRNGATQRKAQLESKGSELSACQAAEAEAATQLKNEQAKLFDLRDRIDRLDKALAAYTPSAVAK